VAVYSLVERNIEPFPLLAIGFYTVPKIWQIFVGKEEEVPRRENFPVISRKVVISTDYWKIFLPGDFLPYFLGNLPCFWDSVITYLVVSWLPELGTVQRIA
jgi:hypothetical protein